MNEKAKPSVQPDSTRLYSHKAGAYAQSRPDYAPEALAAFQNATQIPRQSVVLEVGSGTGILTWKIATEIRFGHLARQTKDYASFT